MQYWLMKSEPDCFGWDQFVADGHAGWDGVRNHQAANNLKAMLVGDRAFFYYSNIGKEIVGLMQVTREAYPDASDPARRFVMVDVKPLAAAKTPLPLAAIKRDPRLEQMKLLWQSRLSVSAVTPAEAKHIAKLIGIKL